jgi:class 3 adenylate cyclase/tetratricopeptide (TPR) repeat protein
MLSCPSCGADIPGGFAFCGRCGTPLSAAPDVEERRVVTVLFCDLVGFTARFDHADPEDVRALLRPYHARLRQEIERFRGTLDKFIGDGVMAVFGAPVAHEDDPERAVRSALAILAAVEELNQGQPDLDLNVRIGVTTGEAVVAADRRHSESVVGDVVNTASRLQGVAPVGGIVVGEPTFKSTRRLFDYEPLPPARVKGKAEPLPIWRVRSARSRFGVAVDQQPTSPFLGRATELHRLQTIYARTLDEASVQLVTVVGEPGVGKSRLVREFHAFVDARPELVAWRQGHCLPYGEGISFWALGEALKAHAGILEFDEPTAAAAKLADAVAAAVQERAERQWLEVRLAPLLGLVGEAGDQRGSPEQSEAFTAWRRFLEALAAKRPLVLVLEDLHWADEALLAFIHHLVEESSGVPLLIVSTARLELFDRAPDWDTGPRMATTIPLPPLSNTDTARLIAAQLDQAVLPAETQTALLTRVGGNPLYAEQVCRMLDDQGLLERNGRTARLARGADAVFPDSIQALIAARLDTLTPERKALLQDAAVVGTIFWSGSLVAIGGRDPVSVRADLEELARRAFIRPARGSSVNGEFEYAFWHALTREVAYSQLPRTARVKKHRAVAGWIEQIAGERVTDHAEMLAHHYVTALELAGAARAADEVAGLQEHARRFLILAGDRAMALDVARADVHYQRALALLPPGHPDRAKILAKAAEATQQAGRVVQAEQLFNQAIVDLQVRGDRIGAGDAMVRQANVIWFRGETARSRSMVAAAIELLEREPPGHELAAAYLEMGKGVLTSGRPKEALDWLRKAISLADRLDADDIRQGALHLRGWARGEIGDLSGLEDVRESVELALRLGLGRGTAVAYGNLGTELFKFEGPAAALRPMEAGLAFCEQRGIVEEAYWLSVGMVDCLAELGRWNEAMGLADQLLARHADLTESYEGVNLAARKAYILLFRGAGDEAGILKERFLSRGRHIGDLQVISNVFPIAALIEQASGDVDAVALLVSELERATRNGPAGYRAMPLPDVARVCTAAGNPGLAKRFLEGAEAPAARYQHCLVTAQAVLAEAHGDLKEAAKLYADAGDRWSNFGVVLEHGQALLGLGRCTARLGRRSLARDWLLDARKIFIQLDARPLLAETDGWLHQVAAQTS